MVSANLFWSREVSMETSSLKLDIFLDTLNQVTKGKNWKTLKCLGFLLRTKNNKTKLHIMISWKQGRHKDTFINPTYLETITQEKRKPTTLIKTELMSSQATYWSHLNFVWMNLIFQALENRLIEQTSSNPNSWKTSA